MNENCLFENLDFNELTKIFIKKAMIIHGEDEFDYSLVEYVNQFTHVELICRQGHIFRKTPKDHLNINKSFACPICSNISKLKGVDKFLEDAKKVHGDNYNYSEVIYKNSREKIIIKCKNGHTFLQTPAHHINSRSGCPTCSKNIPYTKETFLIKAKEVHGEKYTYFIEDKVTTTTKINILCNTCEENFIQCISNHIYQGHGCSNCSRKKPHTTETFIEAAKKAHPDTKFSYEKIQYVNMNTNVIIICPKGHESLQTPKNHVYNKYGCLKCRFCPSCGLFRSQGKLCIFCKPKSENKEYFKTKEWKVVKFLRDELPEIDFVHNKSAGTVNCTDKKVHLFPDIRYDANYYFVIIEVDEHKHRGYNKICEKKRMVDIAGKLGLPCVFLRYNPDHEKSNPIILLQKLKYYLENKPKFDEHTCIFCEYLFY